MSEVLEKFRFWPKIILIGLLSLLAIIPVALINDLVTERKNYERSAKFEVARKWGLEQTLGAIVLSVPGARTLKKVYRHSELQNEVIENTFVHFTPEVMNIEVDSKTSLRKRGIYEVPLYETQVIIKGHFKNIHLPSNLPKGLSLFHKKALLTMGISDMKGLRSIKVFWGEKEVDSETTKPPVGIFNNGIISKIGMEKSPPKGAQFPFQIKLELKGSESLSFLPMGKKTTAQISSNWPDPSFTGVYLPEKRDISDQHFSAYWNIPGLTRNIPPYWEHMDRPQTFKSRFAFGVKFYKPLQNYQLVIRVLKYSLLIVGLTFLTMFVTEALFSLKLHPMHYILSGLSLLMFYTLLLSLSEHLGFSPAYLMACLLTTGSIVLYLFGVTKNLKGAGIILCQLSIVQSFLFVLLKQTEMTLLIGSLGLWIILVLIMGLTYKINWYSPFKKQQVEVV